jgi:uncharacterized UPF0160 family protein
MNIKRVLTHNGMFHADEVLAIAGIKREFPNVEILRISRDSIPEEDLKNPEVWIVDIGGVYAPKTGQYDHHQASNLEASCTIVFKKLWESLWKEKGVSWWYLKNHLLNYVSDVDKGLILERGEIPTFNSLIRTLNGKWEDSDLNFSKALLIAEISLEGYISSSISFEEEFTPFKEVAILDESRNYAMILGARAQKFAHWKQYLEVLEWDECKYLITEVSTEGKTSYKVISRNSIEWPISKHPEQTFLHNSGFLCDTGSLESARDMVRLSINKLKNK